MIDTEISFTSLCYISEDYDGSIWLNRLADIEGGKLQQPFKSGRMDNYFENRDRLYRNDGPSDIGTVGVWDWTAIPNRNNPDIDYVQSYYVQNEHPVRVVVTKADSLEDLVTQLKQGAIYTHHYICDTLFCYQPQWGKLTGFLCKAYEFRIVNRYVKINEDICTLPYYGIHTSEIFNWDDKHLRFLRDLDIGEPTGYFSIGDTRPVVRSLILERITWPFFKECIGAPKAEWRNCKTLLERISGESLYEAVAAKLKCSPDEAKQAVDEFIRQANTMIDAGDIDADVLARIAMHHDDLRGMCEEIVSQKWKESHAVELAQAEAEIAAKKAAAEREVSAIKQRLSNISQELASAQTNRDKLAVEINDAQSRLDHILAEIDQYETLGNETLVAVRQKITDAQKDMAGFIADLSVFLPQAQPQAPVEPQKRVSLWQYECALSDVYSDDEIELSESWNDELNAISQNLAHSMAINGDFGGMLSAFLYAAHINKIPLLVAGPSGRELSEIMAVSLYASGAGHLWLGNEPTNNIAETVADYNECIVSVHNMFGKGWQDELPQSFAKLKKQVIWTHPYVEDMIIEPKGLLNYMLPVLSECFVESIPVGEPWPTKRSEKFKAYTSTKQQPLKIAAFKKLKLSKLLTNRLTIALSDAKAILNQPAKDKDMEILFGLLPLCVITGRIDILKEAIETESGISSAVKAETNRYIEEE